MAINNVPILNIDANPEWLRDASEETQLGKNWETKRNLRLLHKMLLTKQYSVHSVCVCVFVYVKQKYHTTLPCSTEP